MSEAEQMSLLDLYTCTLCQGSGQVRDRDNEPATCPMCLGSGTLDFDPDDRSDIPF